MHPFSLKARAFIKRRPEDDRTISILQGATRSGKTFACIPKILALCRYKVDGHRVICGVTKQTVYKNFLAPLFDIRWPEELFVQQELRRADFIRSEVAGRGSRR